MEATTQMEVLTFRNGDRFATVVTDGRTVKTYEWESNKQHACLSKAIAYLEARGYEIEVDQFNGQ